MTLLSGVNNDILMMKIPEGESPNLVQISPKCPGKFSIAAHR